VMLFGKNNPVVVLIKFLSPSWASMPRKLFAKSLPLISSYLSTHTLQVELEPEVGLSMTIRHRLSPPITKGRLSRKNESFLTIHLPGFGKGNWCACSRLSCKGEIPKVPGKRSLSLSLAVS
jgi:hypothetical protein